VTLQLGQQPQPREVHVVPAPADDQHNLDRPGRALRAGRNWTALGPGLGVQNWTLESIPPSTTRLTPVQKEAAGLAR
jgi:hypothetical protein